MWEWQEPRRPRETEEVLSVLGEAALRCSRVRQCPRHCDRRGEGCVGLCGVSMVSIAVNIMNAACASDEDTELGRPGAPGPRPLTPSLLFFIVSCFLHASAHPAHFQLGGLFRLGYWCVHVCLCVWCGERGGRLVRSSGTLLYAGLLPGKIFI